jgi:hypothetical protein
MWFLGSVVWAASPARDTWTALMASGCRLPAAEIDTPFEARILRNTPYALAGHTFQSAALTAFFRADGGWYQPSGEAVTLDKATMACVEKLQAREAELQRTIPMSAGLMDRMSLDPHVFSTLRFWSRSEGPSYTKTTERRRDDGGYDWTSGYPGCTPDPEDGIECGGYGVICEGPEGTCTTVAAG